MDGSRYSDPTLTGGSIILCADDYAMTAGICDGIEELAAADRISATSAIVTLASWPVHGARLVGLRSRIAVGLHFNLTLGAPLGPMLGLAPSGIFPPLGQLLVSSMRGRILAEEIAGEVLRQLARFEDVVGYPPDFIDGHQHVHVLPGVREGFLRAIKEHFPGDRPLVRDPADSPIAIALRGRAAGKALGLTALAMGFGARVRGAGFPTNRGFAGFSSFDRAVSHAQELKRAFAHPGRRHLVMCHPGYPDGELAPLDAVVERRRDELEAISAIPDLPEIIWRPATREKSGRVTWPGTDVP